jgi:septum formation protein
MKPLVLASASPRRAALLRQLGLVFTVRPAHLPEVLPAADFASAVQEAALRKAQAAASDSPELILGADTVVVVEQQALGKPSSPADAARMLRLLSGRTHQVYTGLALLETAPPGRLRTAAESTDVSLRSLTEPEIAWYVASGEPLDKAGGYGIQGLGASLIRAVRGCYFNVVGLPVARLVELLAEFGAAPWQEALTP